MNAANAKWTMWVLGVLILINISITGYTMTKIDSIERDQKEYVTIEDYRVDIKRIEDSTNEIKEDIKTILRILPKK